MKKTNRPLPPIWVTCFSYFFCLFLLAPIFVIMQLLGGGSVEALGISLESEEGAPIIWMLALDTFLFAGGITGVTILMRTTWAYRFGIAYSLGGLILMALAFIASVDGIRANLEGAALQCAALISFLIHLLRNRRRWETETANKAAHANPLFVPNRGLNDSYNPQT